MYKGKKSRVGSLNKWEGIRSAESMGLRGKVNLCWGLGDYKSWLWKTAESWSFGSSIIVECSILYLEIHWPQSYLLRDVGTVYLEFACKRAYITCLMENPSFRGRRLLKPEDESRGLM